MLPAGTAGAVPICYLCRSECATAHALASGGELLSVCSPCYLATQVVELVTQRRRGHEEAVLVIDALTNILELLGALASRGGRA